MASDRMLTIAGMDSSDDDLAGLLLNYLKDAPEALVRDAADLDGKVVALFGAASVVLGLAAIGNVVGPAKPSAMVTNLLLAAVAAFGLSAITSLIHLWPKSMERSLHADTLWSSATANHKTASQVIEFLLGSIERAYKRNKSVIKWKARTLSAVAVFVTLEVGLIASALIASRL